ncbi:bifunctional DNA-formamidopyrimidine glycosylase/DNA-(apurinic or apyrimidinic site) lyase [Caedibacter taeniospiralis]|uniref:bifunctional DNA-formamidopyrimidine glycosylase/DNA-(apurinic or apyrimidinic site) lyase n=1 Tax=Caedibacter taeniospiralis TaxID=28907 RepID=UPI000C26FD3A|nr:bifunctional DNA-formamidopyrimidine glycosylase/DNA-(apurinic or apyrimidinic site) lyase [Caedibacter taeniospiralis]
MPELPEVETIKNGLSQYCLDRQIIAVAINFPKLRYPVDPEIAQKIILQTIKHIDRRGKYLLIYLNDYSLIIHLGMSGSLQIVDSDQYQAQRHDHIVIRLSDRQTLFYRDPRRFGYWHITNDDPLKHPCFVSYGVEALSQAFNENHLKTILKTTNRAIKSLIMDNKVVVGIGNIYACESLFKAKIHPLRAGKSLSDQENETLVKSIKTTLLEAIEQGGTTLKDYKNATGKPGYFAQSLQVYGQKDKPCQVCKTPIESTIIGQRNTFYCSQCQPHRGITL